MIQYTDDSLLEGRAEGAAVRVENGIMKERMLIPLGDGQVAEGEVEGLLRATEHALDMRQHRVLIVSDSQAGL
jgi:ribonuclease HI